MYDKVLNTPMHLTVQSLPFLMLNFSSPQTDAKLFKMETYVTCIKQKQSLGCVL